jgi:hypothetical protein
MKLGDIVLAVQCGAIDLMDNAIPIRDGVKRCAMRELVPKLREKAKLGYDEMNRLIKQYAPGSEGIERTDPLFRVVMQEYDDFLKGDIDLAITPIYTKAMLEGYDITPKQEDMFYALGLMIKDKAPEGEGPVLSGLIKSEHGLHKPI